MSKSPKGPVNKNIYTSLNDFLDFGPDPVILPTPATNEVDQRLKQLVKKLQEINERIARLSHLI